MSNQGQGPNKFPYLILQNIAGDTTDKISSPRSRNKDVSSSHPNHDVNQNNRTKIDDTKSPSQGHVFSQDVVSGFEPLLTRPKMSNFLKSPNGQNQFSPEFNQALSSISLTQMKAILTAQKEMRKPANSLYPNASQFSLIPETELIYKKYFPSDEKESDAKVSSGGLKYTEKQTSTKKTEENVTKVAGPRISIESNTLKSKIAKSQETKDAAKSVSSSEHVSLKPGSSKDAAAAESRYKRRLHQQLLSITSEVERQSSDIADLRREIKELRQVARRNCTENDSSKTRLNTVSKHVSELDGKLDTIQESISAQEKSILSKLMMIGEMTDSDSDDDTGTLKGLDALSSPSSTKLSFSFSSSTSKRPQSAGASTSSDYSFPKACCNWIPIAPDFDKLLHAVALLNYRMDRNQSMKLCTTNNGATFKHSDVVDLTLFKNGMILGSTGFRSYSTMSVIRFVNEVFNGYLPTELSTQYPDGVVIVLTDKRSVVHSPDVGFNSSGSKLMAKDDPPDLFPGKLSKGILRKTPPESLQPSTTVSQTSIPPLSSLVPALAPISTFEILPDLKISSGGDKLTNKVKVVMLKISDKKNGKKYKLKVPVKATVKEVSEHLATILAEKDSISGKADKEVGDASKLFNIVLPVPYGKLSCLESTLEDYGITQNTLVYIQETIRS